MLVTLRRQPIPGPTAGACAACGRLLPAYGGRCLCGAEAPSPALAPEPGPERGPGVFRIGHLSDLHLGTALKDGLDARDRLVVVLEAARQVECDHLIVSGDLSRVGKWVEMEAAERTLTAGGFPAARRTVVPGNHDLQGTFDYQVYAAFFPEALPSVREVAPGVWIAAVDSNAVPRRDRSPVFERLIAPVQGQVGRESLQAIEAGLKGKPGVRLLVLHHHLARHAPEDLNSRWDVAWGTRVGRVLLDPVIDAAAVLATAREVEVTAIFHGHKHWYGRTGYRVGGVPVFNAGSTTLMARPTFRVFDFEAGRWTGLHEVVVGV